MKFALFYEIPVARPWDADSEYQAYKHTLEQADPRRPDGLPQLLDGRAPLPRGVLALLQPRGALRRHRRPRPRTSASATACASCPRPTTTRCARPSRPPCSTSSATAGSSSAPAARRPGPSSRASASTRTRPARCGARRSSTSSACWTNETSTRSTASTGRCRRAACSPSRRQEPHPPLWGATSSPDGPPEMGEHGIGLCSFTVGVPPEELKERIGLYRQGLAECTEPVGQVRQRPGRHLHHGLARRPRRRPTRSRASRSSGTRRPAPASSPRWPSGWRARTSAPTPTPPTS